MARKYATMEERLIANSIVLPEHGHGDCWVWIGSRIRASSGYYGKINTRDKTRGKTVSRLAHRVAYETFKNKTIPDGVHIDHICEFSLCINPEHLEEVTPSQNVRRQKRWR